jgi:hypothetical protein
MPIEVVSDRRPIMIIWGTAGREREIDTGTFYCPKCDTQRPFTRKKVSRYFTLFFIPIFETNVLGEYLECGGCKTTFKPEVLNIKPLTAEQRSVLMVKNDLSSGTPLQMAKTKLINAGKDADAASQIILQALPAELRECELCKLTYVAGITKCSRCGGQLSLPKIVHEGSVYLEH